MFCRQFNGGTLHNSVVIVRIGQNVKVKVE